MAKTNKEQPVKSVITYEVLPQDVNKAIINGVLQGFATMKNAIIVDATNLPEVINRQTFCLLTGIKPSKYYIWFRKALSKQMCAAPAQKPPMM